jgi:hypothetical protein
MSLQRTVENHRLGGETIPVATVLTPDLLPRFFGVQGDAGGREQLAIARDLGLVVAPEANRLSSRFRHGGKVLRVICLRGTPGEIQSAVLAEHRRRKRADEPAPRQRVPSGLAKKTELGRYIRVGGLNV